MSIVVLIFAVAIVMVTKQGINLITLLPVYCMPLFVLLKKNFDEVDSEIISRSQTTGR